MSKDRGARSLSIGAALPTTAPNENSGRTLANSGVGTGPGDEFVYLPAGPGSGYQFPPQVAWDVSVSGGTMTTLAVTLEESDDGVTWNSLDTQSSVTGGRKVVANTLGRMLRANITTYTVATGTPVVSVGITC